MADVVIEQPQPPITITGNADEIYALFARMFPKFKGGRRKGKPVLTAEEATQIRERFAAGESQNSLAQSFNVHPASIRNILKRRTFQGI